VLRRPDGGVIGTAETIFSTVRVETLGWLPVRATPNGLVRRTIATWTSTARPTSHSRRGLAIFP